jgi:hypothetical protein
MGQAQFPHNEPQSLPGGGHLGNAQQANFPLGGAIKIVVGFKTDIPY